MTEKQVYEVWNYAGSGKPELVSDDPVEIIRWLRERPPHERNFCVHPVGPGFLRRKQLSHVFINEHRLAAAEDIVKRAMDSGSLDGVAKEVMDLCFGR